MRLPKDRHALQRDDALTTEAPAYMRKG